MYKRAQPTEHVIRITSTTVPNVLEGTTYQTCDGGGGGDWCGPSMWLQTGSGDLPHGTAIYTAAQEGVGG